MNIPLRVLIVLLAASLAVVSVPAGLALGALLAWQLLGVAA